MKKLMALSIFFLLIFISIFVNSELTYAADGQKKREIALYSDNNLLTDKFSIILNKQEKKFIPVAGLAKYLGIPIYSFPALGIARGYIGQKDMTFLLNTDACYAYIKDMQVAVPEEAVIIDVDDIYVELDTLVKLLPIKLQYNLKKARLIVTKVAEVTPVQENDAQSKNGSTAEEQSVKKVENKSDLFGGISADYNLSLERKFANHTETLTPQVTLFADAQVLKGNLFFALNGNKSAYKISNWNIRWKNSDAALFSDIRAGYINHDSFPFMPELGETGLIASNYSNEESNSLSKQDFDGNLLPGWEVELYRNGEYLGLSKSDNNGKYKFNGIQLQYGINDFVFKFYGPAGERRTERKVINTVERLLKTDQVRYRLGATFGHPAKQFAENQVSFLAERGLSGSFSVFVEASKLNRAFSSNTYSGLNGTYINVGTNKKIGSFLTRNMIIQNNLPEQKSHLGWAFATENYYQFPSGSISLKGAVAKDFIYPDEASANGKFLSNQFEGSVFGHFTDDFSGSANVKKVTYVDKDEELTQNLSLYASYFDIPMSLDYGFESKNTAGNKLNTSTLGFSLVKSLDSFHINSKVEYDLGKSKFTASTTSISENYKGIFFEQGISDSKNENSKYTWAKISKSFSGLSLGLSYQNQIFPQKVHSITTSISSVGNVRYAPEEKLNLSLEPSFNQGFILGYIFNDQNGNGRRDFGEKGICNADIFIDNILYEKITDNDGRFFVGNMKPYEQHTLTVREGSLENDLVVSAAGYQFAVYPGLATQVDIPAFKGKQISGNIYLSKGNKVTSVEHIHIFLLDSNGDNVKAEETQVDGSYRIAGIHPGRYNISFDKNELKELGYEPLQENMQLEITASDDQENADFYLLPTVASTIDDSIENADLDNQIEQLPIKSVNSK